MVRFYYAIIVCTLKILHDTLMSMGDQNTRRCERGPASGHGCGRARFEMVGISKVHPMEDWLAGGCVWDGEEDDRMRGREEK